MLLSPRSPGTLGLRRRREGGGGGDWGGPLTKRLKTAASMSFNFSRKMFGGTPDVFCMSLIYQAGQQPSPSIQQQLWRRHSPSLESHAEEPATCSLIPGGSTVVVDWKDEDPEREVLGRLKDVQRTVLSIACKANSLAPLYLKARLSVSSSRRPLQTSSTSPWTT